MSNDAPTASSDSPLRQLAFVIGFIADTTEWRHDEYQALTARLLANGKPVLALTLGDVLDAITATIAAGRTPPTDSTRAQ